MDLAPSSGGRAHSALAAAAIVSLLVALAAALFATPQVERRNAGTTAFSASALGHEPFIEMLESVGISVVVSRFDSAGRATDGLLVVAEPYVGVSDAEGSAMLREMVAIADTVLLILPKRDGTPDLADQWVTDHGLLSLADVRGPPSHRCRCTRRFNAPIPPIGAPIPRSGSPRPSPTRRSSPSVLCAQWFGTIGAYSLAR